MRRIVFVAVLAFFIAVMVVLGTTVATAQTPSGTKMEQGQTPGEHKGLISGETTTGPAKQPTAGMMKEGPTKSDIPAESKGGSAVAARVDYPDNCLRVRREPSSSAEKIGCLAEGETLHLTGVFSQDGRWAQLDNNGWVFFGQLSSEVKPIASGAREGSWERPATSSGKGYSGEGTRWHRGSRYSYGGCRHPGYYGYSYGYPSYYGWYGYPTDYGYSGYSRSPGLFGFRFGF